MGVPCGARHVGKLYEIERAATEARDEPSERLARRQRDSAPRVHATALTFASRAHAESGPEGDRTVTSERTRVVRALRLTVALTRRATLGPDLQE